MDRRVVAVKGAHIPQVLIRWNEGDTDTDTWEDVTTIKEQFSDFNFEDKIVLTEGSNVIQEDKENV